MINPDFVEVAQSILVRIGIVGIRSDPQFLIVGQTIRIAVLRAASNAELRRHVRPEHIPEARLKGGIDRSLVADRRERPAEIGANRPLVVEVVDHPAATAQPSVELVMLVVLEIVRKPDAHHAERQVRIYALPRREMEQRIEGHAIPGGFADASILFQRLDIHERAVGILSCLDGLGFQGRRHKQARLKRPPIRIVIPDLQA